MNSTTRVLFAISLGAGLALVFAAPAMATFNENNIGCKGSAKVVGDDGTRVTVNAEDARVVIPRKGIAKWRGSTGPAVHNHHGMVFLDLGVADMTLGTWGSENEKDEKSKKGTKTLPSNLEFAPPGIYAVAGFHEGDEGSCSGRVELELANGERDVMWQGGAAVMTLLAGFGTVRSGFRRLRIPTP